MHSWTWCRATDGDGTAVLYDVDRVRQGPLELGRVFAADGSSRPLSAPVRVALPKGAYGVTRHSRCDRGETVRLVRPFEDGPFYTRSLVDTQLDGKRRRALHEWADIDRFQKGWVQFLLPFKMRVA
jgi:carotenoid 1,2-hydratase